MSELSDLEGDLLFDEIIRQRNEAIRERDEANERLVREGKVHGVLVQERDQALQDLDCGCGLSGCLNMRRICAKCEHDRMTVELSTLNAQRDEALKALRDQRAIWLFAAPTLNAVDLRTFRVPFMEMHNPIGRIDDVLAKYPETKP